MFNHLIESGSHKKDMARKGRFFLGTLGLYGLLLMVAGVASVYAYDSHLGKQDLEVTLITPVPVAEIERSPVIKQQPLRTSPVSGSAGDTIRTVIIAGIDNPKIPTEISTHPGPPPSPPNARVGERHIGDGIPIGPTGNEGGNPGQYSRGVVVPVDPGDIPPPPTTPRPTPAPVKPPDKVRLSSIIISSKVINKPAPPYPNLARQARAQGPVTVEILIDERGRVISAQATSGHPLLRMAAQQSAYQARFSPTLLGNQPVKVSGVITYNFVLQ